MSLSPTLEVIDVASASPSLLAARAGSFPPPVSLPGRRRRRPSRIPCPSQISIRL